MLTLLLTKSECGFPLDIYTQHSLMFMASMWTFQSNRRRGLQGEKKNYHVGYEIGENNV